MEADNQRWSSTINMHRQRTTIRKSAYLLTVGNLAFTFKMADKIDNQIIIDSKNYLPRNQRPQNYSRNRNGQGSRILPMPGNSDE